MNSTEQLMVPLLLGIGITGGILGRFLPMSGWVALILAFVPVAGIGLAQCFC